nr:proteinase inhibitor PSI-1.2-like [Ipomoea trifida]
MASSKVGFLALLVLGIIVMGSNVEHAEAQICPQFCEADLEYKICPPSKEKIRGICENCCTIGNSGCQLYRKDGSPICA